MIRWKTWGNIQGMKRWHKRTACILTLGILGLAALAYRPAFCANTAAAFPYFEPPAKKLSEHDGNQELNIEYRWDISNPPRGTVLTGDLASAAQSLLQAAEWSIRIYTEDGQLKAEYDTPLLQPKDKTSMVQTYYGAYFSGLLSGLPPFHYTPNGKIEAQHYLHLICRITVTPALWQQPIQTTVEQTLSINIPQGTVDLISQEIDYSYNNAHRMVVKNGEEAKLPARFCGTHREQVLQLLLYEFADAALSADADRLQQYYSLAETYTGQLTDADKPWPDCWEEASGEAQRAAQLVENTLTILQENNCYEMQELADFINGAVFARIFGTQLKKREKVDWNDDFGTGVDNIDFEIITEDKFYNDEAVDKKN